MIFQDFVRSFFAPARTSGVNPGRYLQGIYLIFRARAKNFYHENTKWIKHESVTYRPNSKAAGFIPAEDSSPPINGGACYCLLPIAYLVKVARGRGFLGVSADFSALRDI
jgi:hypothetical protein